MVYYNLNNETEKTTLEAFNKSFLQQNQEWVVLVHASWCGHCRVLYEGKESTWNQLVERLKNQNVNVVAVNSELLEQSNALEENVKSSLSQDLYGYPTVRLVNNGQIVKEFQEERTLENLVRFATSSQKHVAGNVETITGGGRGGRGGRRRRNSRKQKTRKQRIQRKRFTNRRKKY